MPFIRGRYHINPIAGEALEQDANNASADSAMVQSGADSDDVESSDDSQDGAGPIHRVEIEAAEMVPTHSGRAQRGFVARLHREVAGSPSSPSGLNGALASIAPRGPRPPGEYPSGAYAPRPETHVFADHRDLVSFLRDQFAKDCKE